MTPTEENENLWAIIEDVLDTFGFSRWEEAELYLNGKQWSRPEETAHSTEDAIHVCLEEHLSLVEAHKKAQLYGAGQRQRAERLLNAIREFRQNAGKHDGDHSFENGEGDCVGCMASYIEGEAFLDKVLAEFAQ